MAKKRRDDSQRHPRNLEQRAYHQAWILYHRLLVLRKATALRGSKSTKRILQIEEKLVVALHRLERYFIDRIDQERRHRENLQRNVNAQGSQEYRQIYGEDHPNITAQERRLKAHLKLVKAGISIFLIPPSDRIFEKEGDSETFLRKGIEKQLKNKFEKEAKKQAEKQAKTQAEKKNITKAQKKELAEEQIEILSQDQELISSINTLMELGVDEYVRYIEKNFYYLHQENKSADIQFFLKGAADFLHLFSLKGGFGVNGVHAGPAEVSVEGGVNESTANEVSDRNGKNAYKTFIRRLEEAKVFVGGTHSSPTSYDSSNGEEQEGSVAVSREKVFNHCTFNGPYIDNNKANPADGLPGIRQLNKASASRVGEERAATITGSAAGGVKSATSESKSKVSSKEVQASNRLSA